MKIKLHEIELNSSNPEKSKDFYGKILGLPVNVDQEGLKCFETGWDGLDLDASIHYPGKVSISFLVDDIDEYVKELRNKGIDVQDPVDSHLGLRTVAMEDPDGYRVEIQSPTENSPEWLRDMIK